MVLTGFFPFFKLLGFWGFGDVTFTSEDPFDDINRSVDLQADVRLDPLLLKNSIKVELPTSKHTLTSQLIKQLQLLTKMPMDAK